MTARTLFPALVCLLLAAPAQAQVWLPGPLDLTSAPDGANNTVMAFAEWDPDGAGPLGTTMVVAGSFTSVGGVTANRVALKNPETGAWQPLGSGMTDGSVRALAVYNGELIAAGTFTNAGGSGISYLARWNGSTWQSLGSGPNNEVYALSIFNGELIASGYFTQVGGVIAAHIGRWNGSIWQTLGSGLNDWTVALGQYNGELIAGGWFTDAGGVAANRVARWNGSTWQACGTGTNAEVLELAVFNGELIAGGRFTSAGGVAASHIARWTSSTWLAAGSGVDGTVTALGNYAGLLYVSGGFTTAGGFSSPFLATWGTGGWAPSANAPNSSIEAFWTYGSELYAGGSFSNIGGDPMTCLAVWNRSRWAPVSGDILNGVFAFTPFYGRFVGGGDLHQWTPFGPVAHDVASWNGTGVSSFGQGMDNGVFALESFTYPGPLGSNELVAGGVFFHAGGVAATHIARWNQSAFYDPNQNWAAMGTGLGSGAVYAIRRYNGVTYAGGTFTSPVAYIAKWNETTDTWEAVGTGLNGPVYALQVYGGQLYAGGTFTNSGALATGGFARWNGTSWSQCGGFFNGQVWSLAPYNGQLAIGGLYPGINSSPNLAQYNGTTYSTFATGGTNGTVRAMAAIGNHLYIGGAFSMAGNLPVDGMARWSGSAWQTLPPNPVANVQAMSAWNGELQVGGSYNWARFSETGIPWFAVQPFGQTLSPGAAAAFTATAAQGYEPLTYQWYRNDVPVSDGPTGFGATIQGAATGALSITNVSNFDAGPYTCRVTNGVGTAISNIATLSMPAPTGVAPGTPGATVFEAIGPNPASTGAMLAFTLAHDAMVTVRVHDVGGRLVRGLDPGRLAAGRHQLEWDTRGAGGEQVAPGLYFVTLACDGRSLGTRRVTVLR